MKRVIVAVVLTVAILVGIQNHGSSLIVPIAKALGANNNCQFLNQSNDTGDRTQHLNGYNVCVTADYMSRLLAKRPYPQAEISDSLERQQITEKLLRFNDPNKIGYLTLLSQTGVVVTTYVVKGKVSSNDSSLTATDQCGGGKQNLSNCLPSPGDDGSYGPNEPGIFFFTTAGVMVQWNGQYLYSDAPQQITSAPLVTYNVSDKPSSAYDIGK